MFNLLVSIPISEKIDTEITDVGKYTSNILGFALTVSALFAFGYLVMGAVGWITAGSDTEKVEEAKKRITHAIVGLAILAASWAIFILLDYFFGLDIANQVTS